MSKIKPLGSRIVVKVDAVKETTNSGIVLAPSNQEKQNRGEVLSIGLEVKYVNIGDKVLYSSYSGTPVVLNEEQILIIKETEVLAIIKEK